MCKMEYARLMSWLSSVDSKCSRDMNHKILNCFIGVSLLMAYYSYVILGSIIPLNSKYPIVLVAQLINSVPIAGREIGHLEGPEPLQLSYEKNPPILSIILVGL